MVLNETTYCMFFKHQQQNVLPDGGSRFSFRSFAILTTKRGG